MSAARLPIVASLALALAGPALGQTQALREADDDVMVPAFSRSADDLEDADLLTASGERIGEIEALLIQPDGQPTAFAVDIGDKEVIIALTQVQLRGEDLVTGLTREQVATLPVWDD